MINKFKEWWKWNRPVITTGRKLFLMLNSANAVRSKINRIFIWETINTVISNLDELEKNTWDKDRVRFIRDFLRFNFEVKDDEN